MLLDIPTHNQMTEPWILILFPSFNLCSTVVNITVACKDMAALTSKYF